MAKGGKRPGAGRPAGVPNKATAEIKELAQKHTGAALKALSEIVKNKTAPEASRVAAAQALLDRGYGRPTQYVDATLRKGPLDDLSADELSQLVNALTRSEAGGANGSDPPAVPPKTGNVPSVH